MLSWSRIEDVDAVINYLETKYEVGRFYLAGLSIGGNMV